MKTALIQIGLILNFVAACILLIDALKRGSRLREDGIQTDLPERWARSCFRHLPAKAFGLLAIGFICQIIATLLPV